jgi:hypothetical protein
VVITEGVMKQRTDTKKEAKTIKSDGEKSILLSQNWKKIIAQKLFNF